jgi:hypothetical protein
MLGHVSQLAILFSRLNASSICQRVRHDLRTSAVEPLERVVNLITYDRVRSSRGADNLRCTGRIPCGSDSRILNQQYPTLNPQVFREAT